MASWYNVLDQGDLDTHVAAADPHTVYVLEATAAISGTLALTGVISPAQITADQNDYDPTGLSTATVLRLTANATRNITGIAGGVAGRVLVLYNVGSNQIQLPDESASSAAANRFAVGGNSVLIAASQMVIVQYDGTTSRWRSAIGAGVSNAVTGQHLRNSAALSVMGRSANSSGDPGDIAATAASNAVLRESGSVLGFGNVVQSAIDQPLVKLVTGATTAVRFERYICDSTGGAFTLTLPASPAEGDWVQVTQRSSNLITIGRNSSEIEDAAADYTGMTANTTRTFCYDTTSASWWFF